MGSVPQGTTATSMGAREALNLGGTDVCWNPQVQGPVLLGQPAWHWKKMGPRVLSPQQELLPLQRDNKRIRWERKGGRG